MHEVIKVTPLENYRLLVKFENGEQKTKDMTGLLDKPAFNLLKDLSIFKSVMIVDGAITWITSDGNEIDLCPDNTYQTSVATDV
jgi:hypothetical protein